MRNLKNELRFVVLHLYIEQNLVELHVFLKTKDIEYISEEADYELASLFSDLGGVIGLYLGLAVVTILEFGEIACKVDKYE